MMQSPKKIYELLTAKKMDTARDKSEKALEEAAPKPTSAIHRAAAVRRTRRDIMLHSSGDLDYV